MLGGGTPGGGKLGLDGIKISYDNTSMIIINDVKLVIKL